MHAITVRVRSCFRVFLMFSASIFRWRTGPFSFILQTKMDQGLYSLSGETPYRKISWSFEKARFGFRLFQSTENLTGTSTAPLPRCLVNLRAIQSLQHSISRLRNFARIDGTTAYRLVNRGSALRLEYNEVHRHESIGIFFREWKVLFFLSKFPWSLLLRVQLTITQHWLRKWLGAE